MKVFKPSTSPQDDLRLKSRTVYERGWIKEPDDPIDPVSGKDLWLSINFAPRIGVKPTTIMRFKIIRCGDVGFKDVKSRVEYKQLPKDAALFDARFLAEGIGDERSRVRANLRALVEGYDWWKNERTSTNMVFMCAAGQNRSVTSSIVFVCSELSRELEQTTRDDWRLWTKITDIAPVEYDRYYEDIPHFLIRSIYVIRPEAFIRSASKDVWSQWIGHNDNKILTMMVGSLVTIISHREWWEDICWRGKTLPPILETCIREKKRGRAKPDVLLDAAKLVIL